MKVRSRRYCGGYIPFDSWMQKGRNLGSDVPSLERLEEGLSCIVTEHLRTSLFNYLTPREMEALSWRNGLVNEITRETSPAKVNRYLAEADGVKLKCKSRPSMVAGCGMQHSES
jgi:hypothetical protein